MTDKQPEALRLAELLEACGILEAADELRRLHQVDVAHGWWLDKTEWVQESSEGDDLGRHRADVMKQRIDRLRDENEALRAALEQPQNHAPDAGNMAPAGWKLLPVEPTQEMLDQLRFGWSDISTAQIIDRWKRTVDAAPQPPAVEQQQVEQEPVAWCALNADRSGIAYFDGRPIIMTGPIGNEHHPDPLYTKPQPKRDASGKPDEWFDRLKAAHNK